MRRRQNGRHTPFPTELLERHHRKEEIAEQLEAAGWSYLDYLVAEIEYGRRLMNPTEGDST